MSQEQPKAQIEEKKLLDPQDPKINVSNKRDAKSYYTISKLILRKFGHLELQSLGSAADNIVRMAEFLERNKLAVIEKISSSLAEVSDSKSQSGTRSEIAFAVKLVKSKEFDDLTKDLK